MTSIDNLLFPVILSSKDGSIEYKNKAARYAIPSPRMKGNICKRINKRILIDKAEYNSFCVRFIINTHSNFRAAFVLKQEDKDLWLFFPELQLTEPEDLIELKESELERFTHSICRLCYEPHIQKDADLPNRYNKLENELIRLLTHIKAASNGQFFAVLDILPSVFTQLEHMTAMLNFRVSCSYDALNFKSIHRIRYTPFAIMMTYLTTLLLRIASTPNCSINAVRREDLIHISFEVSAELPCGLREHCNSLTDLISCFPREHINIKLITREAELYEYKIHVLCSDTNTLRVEMSAPIGNKNNKFIFQSAPPSVTEREFRHLNKRVMEYIKAAFIQ